MTEPASKTLKDPCAECPWRTANHGKRHPHGFYRKDNLRRLWNQIRRGGRGQSCHPTDPTHPDHNAKPDSTPQECSGSLLMVIRELRFAAGLVGSPDHLSEECIRPYLAVTRQRKGLTKEGMLYWTLGRMVPRPIGEGKPLPPVSSDMIDSPEYGRLDVEKKK